MKNIFVLLVICAMLLTLFGCAGNAKQAASQPEVEPVSTYVEGQLNIGYCMVDITPNESVPLQGYGSTLHRFSNSVEYPLKGTVMAITGANGETVILIETDMCTDSGKSGNRCAGIPDLCRSLPHACCTGFRTNRCGCPCDLLGRDDR